MAIVQQSKIFFGYSTIETNSKQQQFADIPLIKRDLLNHFNTIPGQRVMMPTFGCSIWNLLFEPFDDAVRDAIVAECTKVINAETRVVLNNITVNEFNQGIIVQMELIYQPYNVLDSFSVEFDRRAVAMA
jgi:phage baseplate assembly protein W